MQPFLPYLVPGIHTRLVFHPDPLNRTVGGTFFLKNMEQIIIGFFYIFTITDKSK